VQVSHLIDQTMEEPDILNARSMRKTTPFNGDKYARSGSSFHKTNRDDTLNPEIFIKSEEAKPHIQPDRPEVLLFIRIRRENTASVAIL